MKPVPPVTATFTRVVSRTLKGIHESHPEGHK